MRCVLFALRLSITDDLCVDQFFTIQTSSGGWGFSHFILFQFLMLVYYLLLFRFLILLYLHQGDDLKKIASLAAVKLVWAARVEWWWARNGRMKKKKERSLCGWLFSSRIESEDVAHRYFYAAVKNKPNRKTGCFCFLSVNASIHQYIQETGIHWAVLGNVSIVCSSMRIVSSISLLTIVRSK